MKRNNYPKNWAETKQVLRILDQRWLAALKLSDKFMRIKIAKEINALYDIAKSKINQEKKDEFKILNLTTSLNFHQKNLKTFEYWMKSKKIPIN